MEQLDFDKGDGLIPVIAQEHKTGEVLMLAYMNREALSETIESGKATYYSRSRNKLWKKGESSGHVQVVHEIRTDCDRDTILLKVEQVGKAACHLGYSGCFFRKADKNGTFATVEEKIFDPKEVYK
ncbi:MAG: phosphoribosyl-AMP cyclohydrolase [Desulfarculaceae bacterium]|nr:phosphoribosyl-AMP cyclohydrolase [Desulfarculaceae bacterium]